MGIKFLREWSGSVRSILIKSHALILTFALFFILSSSEVFAKITVQDFRGKSIHLNKPAERVVCLIESALTGIYMLRQGKKVVGIPTNVYSEGFYYSDTFRYYAALDDRIKQKKIPAVGNWESINIEKILSLKPDLIIIWSSQTDAIQTFEKLGIPVYGVFITKIDDIFKEIRDFGLMLDAKDRAEELIGYVRKEIDGIDRIARKIKNHKKVFFSWAQHSFLQTSCKGSIINEIISKAGGINICSNIEAESQTLTMEKLIKLNPDVIIMWYAKALSPEDIRNNSQYRAINAVKSGKIYQFDDTFFFDLWTLKFIYSMKFIAKTLYPEFYNFELAKEKRKIMQFLYEKSLL
ncbi:MULTISPECIES: ABC transporter substrate-binding protein [Thermodesulfovibrio]|jgi:iron complex transport system substrate-binding protein|uniref:ABC transporter substrate-binding protein n=1 Tax=Thermodesulfovibrio TaxID=28261 RepID=UPI002635A502|nr:ABC transporter substrate-binding protein [Thermodesulfovibrio sp.]